MGDQEYYRTEWVDIWPWLVVVTLVLGLGALMYGVAP